MQKRHLITIAAVLSLTIMLGACNRRSQIGMNSEDDSELQEKPKLKIKGDSMIYGLSCDGSSDSVIIIWPFKGDPVTYSCIDAKRQGRIIGKPQIGDWIGVMVDPDDPSEVTMVINLDQLKGTWTYPVLPVMKELQNMSPRMQKRMMADIPDSVKQTYFVPREYGFTLKRNKYAQSVGRIMRSTSLEDDSPVQYPEVKNYKEWHTCNGRLILVSGPRARLLAEGEKERKPKNKLDTLDFVYMDDDSLILTHHGQRIGFHRKESALKANAAATKAQQKHDAKK